MPWQPDTHDRAAARLLGIGVDSDAAAVRAAFRRLAKRSHPDGAHSEPTVDIGRLVDARDRLLDAVDARSRGPVGNNRAPHQSVARARRKTPFDDDEIIDLTARLGHLVDVRG